MVAEVIRDPVRKIWHVGAPVAKEQAQQFFPRHFTLPSHGFAASRESDANPQGQVPVRRLTKPSHLVSGPY